MTYYAGSYRWCDWNGTWHTGYPTDWGDCKTFQKYDDKGDWNDCPKPDGYVEGTAGNDVIDLAYKGDPEGDRIDNSDAVLAGEAPQDDIVLAGAGNDVVKSETGNDDVYAGSGNDTVYAGSGNDKVWGEAGNDSLFGGEGNDTLHGDGAGASHRESFNWSKIADPDYCGVGNIDDGDSLSGKTITQVTGDVTVTVKLPTDYAAQLASTFEDEDINTTGIDGGGEFVNQHSSLQSYGVYGKGLATYDVSFSEAVEDVQFRVSDIDANKGQVTIRAWDAAGNPIAVTLNQVGSDLILSNTDGVAGVDTATGTGTDAVSPTSASNSMLVEIAGPVARIEIIHDNVGTGGSAINISDIFFDAVDPAPVGNDALDGGDGDDVINGDAGEDTIVGGLGNDKVFGGDGDDIIDTGAAGVRLPDRGYPGLFPADSNPYDDRDTVSGDAGDDLIKTGDDNDVIYAGSGNDTVNAGFDDDFVSGGDGTDSIVGGEGSDTLEGNAGNDTIWGGLGPDLPDALNIPDATDLRPDNGRDLISGGDGDDVLMGQDDDDTLYGGTGNDSIDGGIDDDLVFGDAGNDTLAGGDGDDTASGGTGNDRFTGGTGADSLAGGDDRDLFVGGTAGDFVDGNEGGDDLDTLDLTGAGPLRVIYDPTNPENGTVEFRDAAGNVTGTMEFRNIENVIPCFTPGTMIATPRGERRVEDLKAGDRVITRDNGIQEIRWVGMKPLNWRTLGTQPHLRPVLVRKGALGHGLPERDMMVSPNHRVLVANDQTQLYFEEREVLVAAKHLVNNAGISSAESLGVSYIHFMFDHHEVVLSDGCWTESFQPGDYTLKGIGNAQRAEILDLFPELKERAGIEGYGAARRTLKKHEAQMLFK